MARLRSLAARAVRRVRALHRGSVRALPQWGDASAGSAATLPPAAVVRGAVLRETDVDPLTLFDP